MNAVFQTFARPISHAATRHGKHRQHMCPVNSCTRKVAPTEAIGRQMRRIPERVQHQLGETPAREDDRDARRQGDRGDAERTT